MKREELIKMLDKDVQMLYGAESNPMAADWVLSRLVKLGVLTLNEEFDELEPE